MAQVKAPALLVREERLDAEAPLVPGAGLVQEVQARDQEQGLALTPLPDRAHQERPQTLRGEKHVRQFHAVAGLQAKVGGREGLLRPARFGQENVLGGAADILPARRRHVGQQIASVELAVAQEEDLAPHRDQAAGLSQQFPVALLGEVALRRFRDQPAQGQRPPAPALWLPALIQHAHHEGEAAAPHGAAVHDQSQRAGRQARHQRLGIRYEELFRRDLWVLQEASEALGPALALPAVRLSRFLPSGALSATAGR